MNVTTHLIVADTDTAPTVDLSPGGIAVILFNREVSVSLAGPNAATWLRETASAMGVLADLVEARAAVASHG